jgi:hypothetical protein
VVRRGKNKNKQQSIVWTVKQQCLKMYLVGERWNARESTFLDGHKYSCGKCSIGRMFYVGMGQKRNALPPKQQS